jgi:multiple sugar transport system permease protein
VTSDDRGAPGRWHRFAGPGLHHLVSIVVAGIFLLPLVWVIAMSLRQRGLPPPRTIEWIPDPISIGNYAELFRILPFDRYLLNSIVVVAFAVPITLVTASMAGFVIAQLETTLRRRLLVFAVALLMVPASALWLTRFLLFRQVGLVDSLGVLVAPAVMGTSPLFVLLFYWAFRRLPVDLFETARIEGAGPFTAWRTVAMPLAVPTTVAVSILTFLWYWSDFISPTLYLKSPDLYTLPVGLRQLQQLDRTDWPLLMAASVLLAAPAVLVFGVAQRHFLRNDAARG